MRIRQEVNICNLDRFIANRDGVSYSLDEVLPKIEEHIIREIDHTFDTKGFREWVNSDSERAFCFNRVRYIWDCN